MALEMDDFERELMTYSEFIRPDISDTDRNKPESLKDYYKIVEGNKKASMFADPHEETGPEEENKFDDTSSDHKYDMALQMAEKDKLTYRNRGRGRGQSTEHNYPRPGFPQEKLSNREEIQRKIRQQSGLGYSNEVIEAHVRAMQEKLTQELKTNKLKKRPGTSKQKLEMARKISSPNGDVNSSRSGSSYSPNSSRNSPFSTKNDENESSSVEGKSISPRDRSIFSETVPKDKPNLSPKSSGTDFKTFINPQDLPLPETSSDSYTSQELLFPEDRSTFSKTASKKKTSLSPKSLESDVKTFTNPQNLPLPETSSDSYTSQESSDLTTGTISVISSTGESEEDIPQNPDILTKEIISKESVPIKPLPLSQILKMAKTERKNKINSKLNPLARDFTPGNSIVSLTSSNGALEDPIPLVLNNTPQETFDYANTESSSDDTDNCCANSKLTTDKFSYLTSVKDMEDNTPNDIHLSENSDREVINNMQYSALIKSEQTNQIEEYGYHLTESEEEELSQNLIHQLLMENVEDTKENVDCINLLDYQTSDKEDSQENQNRKTIEEEEREREEELKIMKLRAEQKQKQRNEQRKSRQMREFNNWLGKTATSFVNKNSSALSNNSSSDNEILSWRCRDNTAPRYNWNQAFNLKPAVNINSDEEFPTLK